MKYRKGKKPRLFSSAQLFVVVVLMIVLLVFWLTIADLFGNTDVW